MNKERDTDRDVLLLSIFTFMTVGLWMFFELVKTAKTTTVASTTQQIITPFSPNIDREVLTELSARRVY